MTNKTITLSRELLEKLVEEGRVSDVNAFLSNQSASADKGEPIRQVRSHGSDCWEDISGESLEFCRSQPEEYEVRTLCLHPAEQPAPVTLVLPSVDQVMKLVMQYQESVRTNVTGTTNWAANLWMTVVDEVARLNGVKL